MALLNAMIDKKPKRLVVDLSSVTYIDSAGLAALIEAMQKVEGYGGKFLLAGLQEAICDIFESVRLDIAVSIIPSTPAGSPDRASQEGLKNALDDAEQQQELHAVFALHVQQ